MPVLPASQIHLHASEATTLSESLADHLFPRLGGDMLVHCSLLVHDRSTDAVGWSMGSLAAEILGEPGAWAGLLDQMVWSIVQALVSQHCWYPPNLTWICVLQTSPRLEMRRLVKLARKEGLFE